MSFITHTTIFALSEIDIILPGGEAILFPDTHPVRLCEGTFSLDPTRDCGESPYLTGETLCCPGGSSSRMEQSVLSPTFEKYSASLTI